MRSSRCSLVVSLLALAWAWSGAPSCAAAERTRLGPPATDGPVEVTLGFYLGDINAIDEESQRFEFEGILTLEWQDERQAFDPEVVGVEELVFQGEYQFSELYTGWWPQLYLVNGSDRFDRQTLTLRIRPDGSMLYVEKVDAVVESPMQLRRIPFDHQRLEAAFRVLAFDRGRVVLKASTATSGHWAEGAEGIGVAEWRLVNTEVAVRADRAEFLDGSSRSLESFVVRVHVARRPGFMIRVIVLPLVLLLALSWSVFWMDRESLGDRMDISFIGVLTVVTYQIVISEHLPQISYLTLLSAFLFVNYLVLLASIVVNLTIGRMDHSGRHALGDAIDRNCRWIFPLAYAAISLLVAAGFLLVP